MDIEFGFCQEKDPNKIAVLLMIDIIKNTNLFVMDRESYLTYCAEREKFCYRKDLSLK